MLHKQMYLIRDNSGDSHASFRNRILQVLSKEAERYRPAALKVVLTGQPPPLVSVIPFKKQKVACISVYREQEALLAMEEMIRAMAGYAGSYAVEEALPVSYEKDWEDGAPTPGVCLLTLFRRKKGLDWPVFINRWHNSHTPLSLRIHPLWNYSRNVVELADEGSQEHWDGLVEEHFRQRSDLLNPFRFFGNPAVILPRMWQVYTDTRSFLDYGTIEPYLAEEYHLISRT